jgi:hypothetical protein
MQYLRNPHVFAIKQYIAKLIPEKFKERETFIERLCISLSTKQDVEDFGKIVLDIYEAGFFRAIGKYREQLEKHGIAVKVTAEELEKKPAPKIFPDQSENSG